MEIPVLSRKVSHFLPLAVFYLSLLHASQAGCSIRIRGDLPAPQQPLIIQQHGSQDGLGLHLPSTSAGIINLHFGQLVRLACPGVNNTFKALPSGLNDVLVRCFGGTVFTHDNQPYEFTKFACRKYPEHIVKRVGECHGSNDLLSIGFEVKKEFFRFMDVCFDNVTLNTLWSRFDLVAVINAKETGQDGQWTDDGLFPGMNPDNLYTNETFKKTLGKILISPDLVEMYITENYVNKGHLTARADFVFNAVQSATFHYINCAPQWSAFNGGNWNQVEQSVRNFTDSINANLKVYTGTYGITKLPDINNNSQELFLGFDENDNGLIPVPALFWKVVYNPDTTKGVAIIGVNNPHIKFENLGPDYLICTDVCDKVKWLVWEERNQALGFVLCCDVNEFRKKVLSLPDFPVNGLLVSRGSRLYGLPVFSCFIVLLTHIVLKS